jgi:predicted glycogen debranching enzyme
MLKIIPDTSFLALSQQEWIVTNGIGGFASSSIMGANTRRYHGLLTAAMDPPTDRIVMVSKVEECIVFGRDCAFSLSSNQYPDAIHPKGYQYLRFFERKPFPHMKFEVNGYHLLKTVFMPFGSNTTVVEYKNTGDVAFKLQLTPLFVFRDYHALFRQSDQFDFHTINNGGYYEIYPQKGTLPFYFRATKGSFLPNRDWYYNLTFAQETARGLPDQEDAFAIGKIDVQLRPGENTYLVFSTDEAMAEADPDILKAMEISRLQKININTPNDPFIQDLMLSGDQFIVKRGQSGGFTLIAGYHWFTDWGRDTMIAMRGLCIAAGKQDVSRSILETFLQHVDGGMLPNRFPDRGGQPEYNTIDATLWLFIVLYEYHQKFDDLPFFESIFSQLTQILDAHIAGTRFNIHVTTEGFLSGGEGLAQLTWMDARVGDYVVTPRHGCPVEIQALWYNALRVYQYFAEALKQPFKNYAQLADRLSEQFSHHFVQPDGGLYDVIVPGKSVNSQVRPNQIYVVSLPFSLLESEAEKRVLDVVKKHLLTPYGLRTLHQDDPEFKPVYEGSPWSRDTAYHQGTVWPFLLGEYATALLKVNNWSEQSKSEVQQLFEPLKSHFYIDNCILGISEVFDGKSPQPGKGTIHQAWSVGNLLKVLLDIKSTTPKSPNAG